MKPQHIEAIVFERSGGEINTFISKGFPEGADQVYK